MVPSGRHTAAGRRRTTSKSSRRPEDLPEIFSVKWPCNVRRWLLRRLWWSTSIEILVSHGKRLTGQPRASQAKRERRFTVHNDTDTQRTLTQRAHTAVCCFSVKWPSDARRWPLRPVASTTSISITCVAPNGAHRPTSCVWWHEISLAWFRGRHIGSRTPPDDEQEQSPHQKHASCTDRFLSSGLVGVRRWLLRRRWWSWTSIEILVSHWKAAFTGQPRASQAKFVNVVSLVQQLDSRQDNWTLTQRARHRLPVLFSVKWPSDARRWPLRPVASDHPVSRYLCHTESGAHRPTSCVSGHIANLSALPSAYRSRLAGTRT
jgi:hypothetical protein